MTPRPCISEIVVDLGHLHSYPTTRFSKSFPLIRSQLINDTLAASVADGPDGSSSAVETDDREHAVLVSDIPWGGFMTVLQRKHVRWKISVRGRFENKADKSEVKLDASFHYQR